MEVWDDDSTNGSEGRDSNDDLDPEDEANYRLQIPSDSHGLHACADIVWSQPNAADTASVHNDDDDSDAEDDPNIVPPLIPRSDDTDSESEDDTCPQDAVPIADIISNLARHQH